MTRSHARQLDFSTITGLSSREAAEIFNAEGANELPSAKRRSILQMALGVIREPMILLLVASGSIYLVLGDMQEAMMLLSFVFVVIGMTLYEVQKTERALEALRDLSSPRALVIRNGERQRIAGREVVRGDMLVLSEGDRVPADAAVLSNMSLMTDEALLTGESAAVRKTIWDQKSAPVRPGGDGLPFVYSGTLIVQGQGVAQVLTTGANTEIGKIGKALQILEPEQTRLQLEIRRLVQIVAAIGLAICLIVTLGYGFSRNDWLNALLAGLTLAMSILPEEFPMVLMIFLALGAWRLSKKQVLTRRMPAVETLGATTVLCVDKTGTLTMNSMSVARFFAHGRFYDAAEIAQDNLPEDFHELFEFSILASQRDPHDPMEKAIREIGKRTLSNTEHLHDDWMLINEYPLSPELLAMSHVWQSPDEREYVIAAKGAPEAIADLCHLGREQYEIFTAHVTEMANQGLRVLGVARAAFRIAALPEIQHDFDFELVGLIGLADPLRPTVPGAIQECYRAGIRVIMITGDYPGTALHIAKQAGLRTEDGSITGTELDQMDDAQLQQRIKRVNIFARVAPEQKLRLVNALKADGEIVAMTGDGVNDAPALKAAHIGIAMGERGTDVARESAALVLLDDDFTSIVNAVKLGRRTFDNLRKAMAYILAAHIPIAGMSLIPVLLHWPLMLLPVHIVFLELIINPSCSVVFEAEAEEADVMRRAPRNPDEALFGRRIIVLSLLQGMGVLLIVFAMYAFALQRGQGEAEARTLAFTALIAANLALIFTNRSWTQSIPAMLRKPNSMLWRVSGGALMFLAATLYLPALRALFHFSPLHWHGLALSLAAGAAGILWFETFKILNRKNN